MIRPRAPGFPLARLNWPIRFGLSDNDFLNNAVYLAEEFLKSAMPAAGAHVDYGMKDEHCWSGDHEHVNAISRLTSNNRFIPLMASTGGRPRRQALTSRAGDTDMRRHFCTDAHPEPVEG